MKANYILASSGGYHLDIKDEGYNLYDPLVVANKTHFKDAVMSRPNALTDMFDIHQYALVTVNGFVHPTAYLDEELFIKNAVPSMLKSNHNHVGVISFFSDKTKPLEKIKISEKMISRDGEYPLYEKTIITLPKETDGIILVFGGYLIFEHPEHLVRISDKSFAFYPCRLDYMSRLYELEKYYTLFDDLGIEKNDTNDLAISFKDATSDETITKLLTRFNTFFVHLKGKYIEHNVRALEHTTIPNNYRTEALPSSPLVGGVGKLIEYKASKYDIYKYTIHTVDARYDNLMNKYTPRYVLDLINGSRRPNSTYRLSSVSFVDIEYFDK